MWQKFKDPKSLDLLKPDYHITTKWNVYHNKFYTEPLIKDGSIYTGVALLFGSSGNMDTGSKYFYEMFMNPGKYNMLEFQDPEDQSKLTGFFSSAASKVNCVSTPFSLT